MRRIHLLQHTSFEGPAALQSWWSSKSRIQISRTQFWQMDYELPNPQEIDGLIVLGGPMGIYDDMDYEWLSEEKDFLRAYLSLEKPVLGICLGAQLLADALGALVYPNPHKEIGFFPIFEKEAKEKSLLSNLPSSTEVLHWHGDTFDLPPQCQSLFSSAACAQQAFQLGEHLLALQFHLECNRDWLQGLCAQQSHEIKTPQKWIQSANDILDPTRDYSLLQTYLQNALDRLFQV